MSLDSKNPVAYTVVRRARSRSITIRITSTGEIVVGAPSSVSRTQIADAVKNADSWIRKQLRIHELRSPSELQRLLVRGIPHLLMEDKDPASVAVRAEGTGPIRALKIQSLFLESVSISERAVERWLRKEAEIEITQMVHDLAPQMSQRFRSIHFKDTSSRWGSCSHDQKLSFSWRLIHAPREVMRYVVIHELAHLEEMNHSQRFWTIVERYDPHHKDHRAWLAQHGRVAQPLRSMLERLIQSGKEGQA